MLISLPWKQSSAPTLRETRAASPQRSLFGPRLTEERKTSPTRSSRKPQRELTEVGQ